MLNNRHKIYITTFILAILGSLIFKIYAQDSASSQDQFNPCQSLTDPNLKADCENITKNMTETKSDMVDKYAPEVQTPTAVKPIQQEQAKPEPLFKSIAPAMNPAPTSPVITPTPTPAFNATMGIPGTHPTPVNGTTPAANQTTEQPKQNLLLPKTNESTKSEVRKTIYQ